MSFNLSNNFPSRVPGVSVTVTKPEAPSFVTVTDFRLGEFGQRHRKAIASFERCVSLAEQAVALEIHAYARDRIDQLSGTTAEISHP